MNIKHENGMVTFLMRTGKDLVKSQMPISFAHGVIKDGKDIVEKDGQIIVDDKYFIPAETTPQKPRKKQKEVKA